MFSVGKIYGLKFPGFAARVIEPASGRAPTGFPFLVESLILRSRWYVNELGEPHRQNPRLRVDGKIGQMHLVLWASALIFAIYFPIAVYLSFHAPVFHRYAPPPNAVTQLFSFHQVEKSGHSFLAEFPAGEAQADTEDRNTSPFVLYENDHALGPGHATPGDIMTKGMGRYSHWKGLGFIFSTSDNSDPNLNKRDYWAVLPSQK